MFNHQPATNKPFSLNISPDSLPEVSLEHDSMTDEVHIKFFNVDDEIVLDLWGPLNDVDLILSGLSIIAKYRVATHGSQQGGGQGRLGRCSRDHQGVEGSPAHPGVQPRLRERRCHDE